MHPLPPWPALDNVKNPFYFNAVPTFLQQFLNCSFLIQQLSWVSICLFFSRSGILQSSAFSISFTFHLSFSTTPCPFVFETQQWFDQHCLPDHNIRSKLLSSLSKLTNAQCKEPQDKGFSFLFFFFVGAPLYLVIILNQHFQIHPLHCVTSLFSVLYYFQNSRK